MARSCSSELGVESLAGVSVFGNAASICSFPSTTASPVFLSQLVRPITKKATAYAATIAFFISDLSLALRRPHWQAAAEKSVAILLTVVLSLGSGRGPDPTIMGRYG